MVLLTSFNHQRSIRIGGQDHHPIQKKKSSVTSVSNPPDLWTTIYIWYWFRDVSRLKVSWYHHLITSASMVLSESNPLPPGPTEKPAPAVDSDPLAHLPGRPCLMVDPLTLVWNSFRIFFSAGLGCFFDFLAGTICLVFCNGLELEFVILHGICHIWACSPSILHGIYYMWACSPSILYGICHILACSPSIFAWDFLHVGMFTFHFVWYLPHFGMFTFHFAWDVLHVSMFTQIFTDAEAWIR